MSSHETVAVHSPASASLTRRSTRLPGPPSSGLRHDARRQPGVDLDPAGDPDGVEHPTVMGDEQQLPPSRSVLPRAARSPVGRGGSSARRAQQVDAASLEQRQRRPRPLPGDNESAGRPTRSAPSPNLANSVRTSASGQSGTRRRTPRQRLLPEKHLPRLLHLAHDDARPEKLYAAPSSRGISRPRRRASRVDLPGAVRLR